MTSILHLPSLRVEKEKPEEDLRKLLHAVKLDWPRDEEIQTQSLSGGFSCIMYKCYVNSNPEDAVTVRVLHHLEKAGATSHEFEKKVLQEASKLGFCSKMLVMFENGYAYDFVKGEPMFHHSKPECILTEEMIKAAAYRLADIHSIRTNGLELEKVTFFDKLRQMLNTSFTLTSEKCPSKDLFFKEINIVSVFAAQSGSPLVICHGDPHLGNIIWNESTGEATFVDWELTQVLHRAYDLYYFQAVLEFFEQFFHFPIRRPEDLSEKLCRFYLEKQQINNGKSEPAVNDEEVKNLLEEVSKIQLLVYLFYIICNVTITDVIAEGGIDTRKHFDLAYKKYTTTREALLGNRQFGEP